MVVLYLNIVHFPYKFVENPTLEHERLIDYTLDDRLKNDIRYAQQFMLMLLQNYTTTLRNCTYITKPPEVIAETQTYLDDNNQVRQFISKYLEITGNRDDMMSSSEMFTLYRDSEYYNKKDKGWFKDQMKLNGLKPEKKTTRGLYHKSVVYFGVKVIDSMFTQEEEVDNIEC